MLDATLTTQIMTAVDETFDRQTSVLADLVPRKRNGEFIGLASFVWSIVQPLGSFLAGSLVDHFHSDRWAFGFAGVGMALAVLALFAVHPQRARFNTESE